MMNCRAFLNVCQTARLYVHLMVPERRTRVSAAIQDGSLLPWAPPLRLVCMNSSKKEPKWCNLPGGRLHIKMCMKRGDMGERSCVGRRFIKNLKKKNEGEVSAPWSWRPLKHLKDAEVTQMSESADTRRESHSVWSSHNLISPKVRQHEFATLSDSFYIIRATWPAISFCAPSLTQLSHLQHSASFMSKNQKSTEREQNSVRILQHPLPVSYLWVISINRAHE